MTYRYVFGLGVYPGRMYCQASPSELARSMHFRNRNRNRHLVVVTCLSAYPRSDSRVGKTGTIVEACRSVKEAVTPGGRARPPEGIRKARLLLLLFLSGTLNPRRASPDPELEEGG